MIRPWKTWVDKVSSASCQASRRSVRLPRAAALIGVAATLLAEVPLLHATMIGNFLRWSFVATITVLVIRFFPRVFSELSGSERAALLLYGLISMGAIFVAYASGNPITPSSYMKYIFLYVIFYIAPKFMRTKKDIEIYFSYFILFAIIASVQSVIAMGFSAMGIRDYMSLHFFDGEKIRSFSFLGLLGAYNGQSVRAQFYYSEPSHFAHVLIAAFALALGFKKVFRAGLIAAGMFTTIAFAAWAALAAFILAAMMRFGLWLMVGVLIAVFGLIVWQGWDYIAQTQALWQLTVGRFAEGGTVDDKWRSLLLTFTTLQEYPLGYGLIEPNDLPMAKDTNLSQGMLRYSLQYGLLCIPMLMVIYGFILYRGIFKPLSRASGLAIIGLGAVILATHAHGPLIKYWMVFMLSALVSYTRLERREQACSGDDPV